MEITASERGLRVTALKIDPYINVDAGTMNPTEHGEVFVMEDGKYVINPMRYQCRLAGKPAGYLYNQLLNFRDGTETLVQALAGRPAEG